MKYKLLITAIMLCCMVTTINAKNMNTVTLNKEQAACLEAIACLEAKGDQPALAIAINKGLDAGLTVSQIKEALSHLYAYTGFPRSLNALGTLARVIDSRKANGESIVEGQDASPLPKNYDALREGSRIQTKVSGRVFDFNFCPATDYYLKAHLFGDIFARDNLTHAERELVTVSALSGLTGVEPQLRAHVGGARNMGVTDEQLRTIPTTLAERVGAEEGTRAAAAIGDLLKEQVSIGQPSSVSPWLVGQPNTAFAKYFIGNSYLAPMDGGVANVTFEPRCRNNWHIHHGAVQVLICVHGRGWYQEWGKPAVELREGMIIAIPEGVKHWHGAARDSWFQHLAMHTQVQEGSSTEWLEPVNDDDYDKLEGDIDI